ncbi:hypothetical protein [Niallia taxi]|uniref:Uncharacterized protein n=1 Tax=Niallia taxi TaxID=2499688 RepID=A0A437K316_9BACI|nr:hypothetical protein [Niallia taxi]RVT56664.1 hypothetical protein EM808_26705 [Niallia taxi]
MENITSLYVNADLKSIPIQLMPSFIFTEENTLSVHHNDYFLVGSVKDITLIGNKIAEIEMKKKKMDILSKNESEDGEWIAIKNSDKYNVYSKKKELLTSIPTKLWMDLELES